MQRLCCQLSLNKSLYLAVSTLVLTTGLLDLGFVNPHTIGNTVSLPALEGAITGTMSVGLISPSVFNGRERAMDIALVREDFSALEM